MTQTKDIPDYTKDPNYQLLDDRRKKAVDDTLVEELEKLAKDEVLPPEEIAACRQHLFESRMPRHIKNMLDGQRMNERRMAEKASSPMDHATREPNGHKHR